MTIDHTGNIVPRRSEAAYMARYDEEIPYIPDPETFEAEKRAIQATWDQREERKRAGANGRRGWTPPHGTAHISEPAE